MHLSHAFELCLDKILWLGRTELLFCSGNIQRLLLLFIHCVHPLCLITIILTNLSNPDDSKYGTIGGNATQDKIFLLSVDEVKKYFNDDKDRKCKATGYAKQQGVYTEDLDNCFWWLRSPGCVQLFAACVYINGGIRDSGQNVCYDHYAVRPALWINL